MNQNAEVKKGSKIWESSTFIEIINGTLFIPKGEVEGKVEFAGDKKQIPFIVVKDFKI